MYDFSHSTHSTARILRQDFYIALPGWNSLCRLGWPETHRDLPASASRTLGLKACATTVQLFFLITKKKSLILSHIFSHLQPCAACRLDMPLRILGVHEEEIALMPSMVAHTFNASTQEAEAGGFSVSSRPAWSTQFQVSQSCISETLFQKQKGKKWL